jgi:hypothetical protein
MRRAALLWTPSPFLGDHQALLMSQSRSERTIDAVALRGSLERLRGVFDCIYGALPLGELSLAFPSLFERRRRDMTSESDEAKVRPVDGLDGVQTHLPQAAQPHHVVDKVAFTIPVLVVAAVPFSPPLCPAERCPRTCCPTPKLDRQVLLPRRRKTGRCSPRVGNDVGN